MTTAHKRTYERIKNGNTLNGSGRHLSYFARAYTESSMTLHSAHHATTAHSSRRVYSLYPMCARTRAMHAILVCNTKWHKIKINFSMLVSFKLSLFLSPFLPLSIYLPSLGETLEFSNVSFVYSLTQCHDSVHLVHMCYKRFPPLHVTLLPFSFSYSIDLLHTI